MSKSKNGAGEDESNAAWFGINLRKGHAAADRLADLLVERLSEQWPSDNDRARLSGDADEIEASLEFLPPRAGLLGSGRGWP